MLIKLGSNDRHSHIIRQESRLDHLFLPVAGVPRALGDIREAILDPCADVREAVAHGAADTASQTSDCLAETTGGSACGESSRRWLASSFPSVFFKKKIIWLFFFLFLFSLLSPSFFSVPRVTTGEKGCNGDERKHCLPTTPPTVLLTPETVLPRIPVYCRGGQWIFLTKKHFMGRYVGSSRLVLGFGRTE